MDLNVRTIDDALISPNDTAFAAVKPCCSVSSENLSYSAKFGTSVDSGAPCSVNGLGRVESSVTDSFRRNLLGATSGLKWQYYIPDDPEDQAWLPDSYSKMSRLLYVFGPLGLKDYGSAMLHCKI